MKFGHTKEKTMQVCRATLDRVVLYRPVVHLTRFYDDGILICNILSK